MAPAALLLDMDGTLTAPVLDFPRIRREMGIEGHSILEGLANMEPARRAQAQAVLHRHEEEAAANCLLNSGCLELVEWSRSQSIPMALITRNSRKSVDVVLHRHNLEFDALITRDDGLFKPDPAPLRVACERVGVNPQKAWMVGDGRYDVEAGLAAGMRTVWISHGKSRDFPAEPWRVVTDLHELLRLVRGASSG